ncbi:MAG: hypothetical protein ACT4OE_04080 [Sphingosinicella sp.]
MATKAIAQPQGLGIYGLWGAFRSGDSCYAITQPTETETPGGGAYVAVAHWPRRRLGSQVSARLSRPKRDGSAVLLRIDGRSFLLNGRGRFAWAPGGQADDEIVAAMRIGLEMSIETRAADGHVIRDLYPLRGAATAMDAAALACWAGN